MDWFWNFRIFDVFDFYEVFRLDFDEEAGISVERCDPEILEEVEPEKTDGDPGEGTPDESGGVSDEVRSRFAELRRAIRETDDQDRLADLLDEMMSLRKL